jgi:hypothetical protein
MKFDGRGGWDDVSVAGALSVEIAHDQRLQSLTIAGGSSAFMPGGRNTLVTRDLQIAPTGALDLADNDLLWDFTGDSPYERARDYVLAGRDGGVHGIISTAGAGDRVLGLADAALLAISSWNEIPLDGSALVGRYTYYGDANLDGQVTTDDYVAVDLGLGTGTTWPQGDVDYNGQVTTDDYVVIDLNLGKGTPGSEAVVEAEPTPGGSEAVVTVVEEVQTVRRANKKARSNTDRR